MTDFVSADELARQLNMQPHEEGGAFLELESQGASERKPSGSIYYYLPQGAVSDFHVIDCDEYWTHSAGDVLELWVIDEKGELSVQRLGVAADANPLVKVTAGCIFAARHAGERADGTFVSCITVPQFRYEGWRLVSREDALSRCPAAGFWE